MFAHLLEHGAIELNSRLIGLGVLARGEDAAPVDGDAQALKAHLVKKGDVLFVMMVEVDGLVAGIVLTLVNSGGNHARRIDGAALDHVGNGKTLTVLEIRALALVGGKSAAPEKTLGKSGGYGHKQLPFSRWMRHTAAL